MQVVSTENYTYDNMGNPLTAGGKTFTWWNGRELADITENGKTARYEYNNGGTRISKIYDRVRTDFYYSNGVLQAQRANNNVMFFNYDGN